MNDGMDSFQMKLMQGCGDGCGIVLFGVPIPSSIATRSRASASENANTRREQDKTASYSIPYQSTFSYAEYK